MKTLIIVPTYNESQNIEKMIRAIFDSGKMHLNLHIMVVDDNAGPDSEVAGAVMHRPFYFDL